jgi:DNA-binding GntR family transcriptional regulator/transposase
MLRIADCDREALTKLTASRRTSQGQSTRARIVLACADGTMADAARRCGVDFRTAAKWKKRYEQWGIDGLADSPRAGRPATTAEAVNQTLTCVLREPPARGGWTTRLIAESTGLSQSTVCRIRRDHFPKSGTDAGINLAAHSAIVTFVHAGSGRRVLAFHSPAAAPDRHRRRQSTPRQISDAIETVLCAALVSDAAPSQPKSPTAVELLRRAVRNAPIDWSVTVITDFELDEAAKQWLRLSQLHVLAAGIDAVQLPELIDLQRQIRRWHVGPKRNFEWSRVAGVFDSEHESTYAGSELRTDRRPSESALVIRGLVDAIADGTLHAGRKIGERTLAARLQLTSGIVSETLRHLAEDGLVDQDDAGHFFVPAPSERDVLETYTARGLLGTAIVRRLASRIGRFPAQVDDVFKELVWCASQQYVTITASLDLDVQDELARAAEMPRIEAMFLRLTLQLRLITILMGLSFQYPVDEIVDDDGRILDAIRCRDPEAAVAAWRHKIDNCARYMMQHVEERPRR